MALSTIPAVASDSSSTGGARQNENIAPLAKPSTNCQGNVAYPVTNINDKNEATGCWFSTSSGGGTGKWVQLTWSSKYSIEKFKLIIHGSSPGGSPTNRNLAGGDVEWWDGSQWVLDQKVSNQNSAWEITLTKVVSTDQIRIINFVTTGTQASNPVIYEWYVYEGSSLEATVEVKPSNLHFNSNAKFLNVRITGFPDDPTKSAVDIDGSTVSVMGFGTIVKYDKNVDSKYMGKVDRQIIMDAIGSPGQQIELKVTGQLNDGTSFTGTCYVKAS
jgi:hypothetical protein